MANIMVLPCGTGIEIQKTGDYVVCPECRAALYVVRVDSGNVYYMCCVEGCKNNGLMHKLYGWRNAPVWANNG